MLDSLFFLGFSSQFSGDGNSWLYAVTDDLKKAQWLKAEAIDILENLYGCDMTSVVDIREASQ